MVMQKLYKIQDIESRVMNFRESTRLYHINQPTKYEQNPTSGSRVREQPPKAPPPQPGPGKMHDVMFIALGGAEKDQRQSGVISCITTTHSLVTDVMVGFSQQVKDRRELAEVQKLILNNT